MLLTEIFLLWITPLLLALDDNQRTSRHPNGGVSAVIFRLLMISKLHMCEGPTRLQQVGAGGHRHTLDASATECHWAQGAVGYCMQTYKGLLKSMLLSRVAARDGRILRPPRLPPNDGLI